MNIVGNSNCLHSAMLDEVSKATNLIAKGEPLKIGIVDNINPPLG